MEQLEKFIKEFQGLYPKEVFSPIRRYCDILYVVADTNYYEFHLDNDMIVLEVGRVKTKHPNLTPEMAGTVLDALLTESWKE